MSTDRASALVDWISRKRPFELYGELNGSAMALCRMDSLVSWGGFFYHGEDGEIEWFELFGGDHCVCWKKRNFGERTD